MRTKKLILGIIILFLLTACVDHQSENINKSYQWNWGSNWEKGLEEQKHYIILTDMIKLQLYDKAKEPLNWLLKENSKLNPSLYKCGFIIYENLINDCYDPRIKSQLKNEEKKLKELMKKNFPFVENGS